MGVGGTSACSNARKAVHQHAATVTGVVVVAAAAVATVVVIADFARAGGGSGVAGGRGHGEESAVGRQLRRCDVRIRRRVRGRRGTR